LVLEVAGSSVAVMAVAIARTEMMVKRANILNELLKLSRWCWNGMVGEAWCWIRVM
jgi:hypothetical protein